MQLLRLFAEIGFDRRSAQAGLLLRLWLFLLLRLLLVGRRELEHLGRPVPLRRRRRTPPLSALNQRDGAGDIHKHCDAAKGDPVHGALRRLYRVVSQHVLRRCHEGSCVAFRHREFWTVRYPSELHMHDRPYAS